MFRVGLVTIGFTRSIRDARLQKTELGVGLPYGDELVLSVKSLDRGDDRVPLAIADLKLTLCDGRACSLEKDVSSSWSHARLSQYTVFKRSS